MSGATRRALRSSCSRLALHLFRSPPELETRFDVHARVVLLFSAWSLASVAVHPLPFREEIVDDR
jgi:hypothetical protein